MADEILVVDKSGNPRDWTGLQKDACKYYAEDMVICELGSPVYRFHGGINTNTGIQSKIDISSIIMVTGPVFGRDFYVRETVFAEREILYARDMFTCGYCGIQYLTKHGIENNLTIDHITPRAHGGRHTWVNTITACKSCNHGKADRTPQQADMELLFIPYAPNLQEKLLLMKNKVVKNEGDLAMKRHTKDCVFEDQLNYLMAKIPKHSRTWNNTLYTVH